MFAAERPILGRIAVASRSTSVQKIFDEMWGKMGVADGD
jgi:hypothetical protein